jgi:hypothetical protein
MQVKTWFFTAPDATIPAERVNVLLGTLPHGNYWMVATARIAWGDDSEATYRRFVNVALDVDGFDSNGNPVDWDSGIFLGHDVIDYQADGLRSEWRDLAIQNVVSVPTGGLTLKLAMLDQSNITPPVSVGGVSVLDYRLVVTEVLVQ